jgi:two-component system invasion response regulator UvrY
MSRLYLIDDHALMREGLRALLEGAGHQVIGEADTPTPAIADIVRLNPDVVLLDLNLGERSGFEVLEEIARRKLGTRVVVLTMSNQPRHVAEALRMGALGYALKGEASTGLLKAIAAAVAGRRYLGVDEAELAVRGLTDQNTMPGNSLSPRERQILLMVARGASSTAIGELLHLSSKTVDTYRSRLMAKLNLGDVAAVVRWAIRNGLISADEP